MKAKGSSLEIARVLFPWLYTENFFSQPSNFEAGVAALEAHPYPMDPKGVGAQLDALKEFDSTPRLRELRAPTLVMAAENDMLVSVESCRELTAAIPNGRLKLLENTGHSCMLETPDLFSAATLEFLLS